MSRGYTLLELLVVLAIVGLVLAAVPVVSGFGRPGPEVRATAFEVASALRQTRSAAISQFRPQTFRLDVEARKYWIGGDDREQALPADLAVRLYTARSEVTGESKGAIRFYPDGSATGGRVTIGDGERSYTVSVDWLTGHVGMEP